MVLSSRPFARKFKHKNAVLDKIDRELLKRHPSHFTHGGWCSNSDDICLVILKEKMVAQQEHIENQEKRHQEQMENQEKRHQQKVANIYKLLQKAGILTQEDNGDASNNNHDSSNQFSDAR